MPLRHCYFRATFAHPLAATKPDFRSSHFRTLSFAALSWGKNVKYTGLGGVIYFSLAGDGLWIPSASRTPARRRTAVCGRFLARRAAGCRAVALTFASFAAGFAASCRGPKMIVTFAALSQHSGPQWASVTFARLTSFRSQMAKPPQLHAQLSQYLPPVSL